MSITASDIAKCWEGTGDIKQIELTDGGLITVGKHGCTRLEKWVKHGELALIPYVRVWMGGKLRAEFCQHRLNGVTFA